jgi:ATP-dependent Lhr-like helicase
LPRRRPGQRTPLWQQRKRAADLLAVASRYGSFPALLETYREVLRDHFDMPALVETLSRISTRALRVTTIDSRTPSPFAASLLFSYVANYIYDGDAPLAERRAQALSVDQNQLRELLADAELRDLLDAEAIVAMERQLQQLEESRRIRTADQLHDLLIRIGDLTAEDIAARSSADDTESLVRDLTAVQRIARVSIAGEFRYIAMEDAARYRDALGVALPADVPAALLEPVADPTGDLVARYARSHGPFTSAELLERYRVPAEEIEPHLRRMATAGRIVEGEFRPRGAGREWVDASVLRTLRRRSLAKLRHEIEPVEADALGRFLISWHGIGSRRLGSEALLDAIEQLQGAAIPASVLEPEVLAARVDQYHPGLLDMLVAAGEVVWVGVEPLGDRDGRIALYLTDHLERLRPPAGVTPATASAAPRERPLKGRAADVLAYLRAHGASFFHAAHEGTGGGFPQETVDALWDLVWRGAVTNDTLHPLRAFLRPPESRARRPLARRTGQAFRSRRLVPPTAEGRWSAVPIAPEATSLTSWSMAITQQLLARHGVVTRETAAAEVVPGGFTPMYQVLKAMEEGGRIRRGYFVAGLGAAQFALPPAVDLLRAMRDVPEVPRTVVLAATDPANPYGTSVKWPLADASDAEREEGRGPTRSAGARVILVDGILAGYFRRGERDLLLCPPDAEPRRSQVIREVARALRHAALARDEGRRGMLLETINGAPAGEHAAAHLFISAGFVRAATGLQVRAVAGISIAGFPPGGSPMADEPRDHDELVDSPDASETREGEHERVRSSNDEDQEMEREGIESRHNRGYDETVRGREGVEDIDPDSADSDVERDDSQID